jgi:tellurium resistance protein TerD
MNAARSYEEIERGVMKVLAPFIGDNQINCNKNLKQVGYINKSNIDIIRKGLEKEFNIAIEEYYVTNLKNVGDFILCVRKRFMDIEYKNRMKENNQQHEVSMKAWNDEQRQKAELYQSTYNKNEPKCSKCGSKSITAGNKGFGVGKAAAGAVLLGPVGLIGGFIGSKKTVVTCLNCGHKWEV